MGGGIILVLCFFMCGNEIVQIIQIPGKIINQVPITNPFANFSRNNNDNENNNGVPTEENPGKESPLGDLEAPQSVPLEDDEERVQYQ